MRYDVDIEEMKKLFRQTGDDGIISKNNYIDVFAVATRAQAIANEQLWLEREYYENGSITELNFEGYATDANTKAVERARGGRFMDGVNKALSFQAFLDKLTKGDGLFADPEEEKIIDDTSAQVGQGSGSIMVYHLELLLKIVMVIILSMNHTERVVG